ncbi:hypothetical protein GORHZ_168_00040 [Gordonia rhizosphera NBRC 16068]|uniref:Uncharacterized protein n=2 Tax=Gordonia rhizosphera TaxID=83341 RepID=K6WJ60_9ACTN|nr:hypothetical protein GORHZ_168_00040 [Gordonia rhizosphera NBRC 16068]
MHGAAPSRSGCAAGLTQQHGRVEARARLSLLEVLRSELLWAGGELCGRTRLRRQWSRRRRLRRLLHRMRMRRLCQMMRGRVLWGRVLKRRQLLRRSGILLYLMLKRWELLRRRGMLLWWEVLRH